MQVQSVIWPIVVQLKQADTQQEKRQVLRLNKNESLLSRLLYLTYNPWIKFYVSNEDFDYPLQHEGRGFSKIMEPHDTIISDLMNRHIDDPVSRCLDACKLLNFHDMMLFRAMLDKDLDVGIDAEDINSVWPDLIPEFQPMQPAGTVADIEYPCAVQMRPRGPRRIVIVRGDEVEVRSNTGQLITESDHILTQFRILAQEQSMVFDGCAINGQYILWDVIQFEGFARGHDTRMSMRDRFWALGIMIGQANQQFEQLGITSNIETVINATATDAAGLQKLRTDAGKPVVAKNLSSAYHAGPVTHQTVIQ